MVLKSRNNQQGFSLVELMIVVAIIGVLSALAIPKFQTFQAKARMAESKSNLNTLYTLEESYFADNDTYVALAATGTNLTAAGGTCPQNTLGFVPAPCNKSRYQYTTTAATTAAFTAQAITGTAANNKVFPGCATADTWTITNQKVLTNTSIALSSCG
jgi:type IV pilus assembly protein PilA